MAQLEILELMQGYLQGMLDSEEVTDFPELSYFCVKNELTKAEIPDEALEVFYNFQLSYLNKKALRGLIVPSVALRYREEIARELRRLSMGKQTAPETQGAELGTERLRKALFYPMNPETPKEVLNGKTDSPRNTGEH